MCCINEAFYDGDIIPEEVEEEFKKVQSLTRDIEKIVSDFKETHK